MIKGVNQQHFLHGLGSREKIKGLIQQLRKETKVASTIMDQQSCWEGEVFQKKIVGRAYNGIYCFTYRM